MELDQVIEFCVISFIFIAFIYTLIQRKLRDNDLTSIQNKFKHIVENLNKEKQKLNDIDLEYNITKNKLKHLLDLKEQEVSLHNNIVDSKNKLSQLVNEIKEKKIDICSLDKEITSIKNDISIFMPNLDLINVGFFDEPDYLYETSVRFKEEIKDIRDKQRQLISNNKALTIPDEIALIPEKSYSKKILTNQAKLMLKALNLECDNLISLLKTTNYALTLERIDKVATEIEKHASSLKCGFSKEYIELKFKECELQYQCKLKQQREKEEQQLIKEQIREEQKAIREFERAKAKAQKEEEMYQHALEDAKKQLTVVNDVEKSKLEEKIVFLEQQFKEAIENKKRAISMAEQTKRGHVYIISNIGSFGEGIYKIGLTRRLDPTDRVKELGDASVPFSFDIHAMIYHENAPSLESQLHKSFTNRRVNAVNFRKEFFSVSLEEIKNQVEIITGTDINFKMTALAEDYHESKKIHNEN